MAHTGRSTAQVLMLVVMLFAAAATAHAAGNSDPSTSARQLLWPESKANPAKPSAPKQLTTMGDTAATEFARLGNRRLQQHAADQAQPTVPTAPKQASTHMDDSAAEDFARLGKCLLAAARYAKTQQRQLLWPESKANPAKPAAPKQITAMGDTAATEFARLGNRRLQQHAADQAHPTVATAPKQASSRMDDSAAEDFARLGKRLLAAASFISSKQQQRQLLWPESKANPAKPSAPKQVTTMGDTATTEFARLGGHRRQLLWPESKANPAKPSAPKQAVNMGDTAAAEFARLGGR